MLDAKAPQDGTALGHLSDEALVRELVRRRAANGAKDLDEIERLADGVRHSVGEETLASVVAALPVEGASPKPCPKCGAAIAVKARNRVRHVLTIAGELRLARNYHYCERCEHGFYPRDQELNLPETGELSAEMERRVLDFGVNDTFASAAERWSIHYPLSISPNLVRRVVDRVGLRMQQASSELSLQEAALETPKGLPRLLVVATDGSMLLTREESWKEAKVAVVARSDASTQAAQNQDFSHARYVAVLGGQQEFGDSLSAALAAERADEASKVVWLGDGAKENWTLAKKCCPLAIQVLDLPHAIQNGMVCGKVLLGEVSDLLPIWEKRLRELLYAPSPDEAIRELMDCVPLAESDEALAALDQIVGYYRANEKRMQYSHFRELDLPIGSGIVESAHRHVLQVRMKRAGQRWSLTRARRMTRLRATYRTAGPRRFHAAIRAALGHRHHAAPRSVTYAAPRISRRFAPSRVSSLNRDRAAPSK